MEQFSFLCCPHRFQKGYASFGKHRSFLIGFICPCHVLPVMDNLRVNSGYFMKSWLILHQAPSNTLCISHNKSAHLQRANCIWSWEFSLAWRRWSGGSGPISHVGGVPTKVVSMNICQSISVELAETAWIEIAVIWLHFPVWPSPSLLS